MRILFSIALLYSVHVCAQNTLYGTASSFSFDSIFISEQSSKTLHTYTPILSSKIDSTGYFSIELPLTLPAASYEISVRNNKGYIFLGPKGAYQVQLSPSENKLPVYKRKPLIIDVLKEPEPYLNKKMEDIVWIIDSIGYSRPITPQKTYKEFAWDSIRKVLQNTYPLLSTFIDVHTTLAAFQEAKKYKKDFENPIKKDFDASEQALFILFQSLYNDFENRMSDTQKNMLKQSITIGDVKACLQLVEQTDSVPQKIRPWLTIQIITRWALTHQINTSDAIQLFKKWKLTTSDLLLKKELQSLISELPKMTKDNPIASFSIQTESQALTEKSLSKEKYSYVFFITSWCTSCIQELIILNSLQEKYVDVLDVYLISLDEEKSNYDALKTKYSLHSSIQWAYFNKNYRLISDLNVLAVPYAYLISPTNNLELVNTLPSNELELTLQKIQSQKKQKNTKNKPLSDGLKK